MRVVAAGRFLLWLILLPKIGTLRSTYSTDAGAAGDGGERHWQINGEPIFFAGSLYYPTGPRVFFDGQLMARSRAY